MAPDDPDPLFSEILLALPPPFRRPLLDKIVRASPEIAAAVAGYAPAVEPVHKRVRRRDDAIRAAIIEHYCGLPPTCAARKLAADLTSAARAHQRNPSLPVSASAHRRALFEILEANQGRALQYRRICMIAGPRK